VRRARTPAHAWTAALPAAAPGRHAGSQPRGRATDQPGGGRGRRVAQYIQAFGRGRRPRLCGGRRPARAPGAGPGSKWCREDRRQAAGMLPGLTLEHPNYPLVAPFRISRGVRTATEVVVATVSDGTHVGRGESLPYPRYGESVESVMAQVASLSDAVTGGLDRRELQDLLEPGAARNALDCALWDLQARRQAIPVASLLGHSTVLPSLASAHTVSLDTPANMAHAAKALRHLKLV